LDDSAELLKAAILGAAAPTTSLAGKTVSGGRLDISKALAPEAPTSAVATAVSATEVNVTWGYPSTAVQAFDIERSSGTEWTKLTSVGSDVRTYLDISAKADTSYTYRITARSLLGNSSATTSVVTPPPAPESLAATVSEGKVMLAWSTVTSASGYVLERWNDFTWDRLWSFGADATSYEDTDVAAGILYTYRIKALGATPGSESAYTSTGPVAV
jgi:hypothetical protein